MLIAANVLATILRYALYRSWVFRGRSAPPRSASPPAGPELGLTTLAQRGGSAR